MDNLTYDLINYIISKYLKDKELINLYKYKPNIKILLNEYYKINQTTNLELIITNLYINTISEYNFFIQNIVKYNNIKKIGEIFNVKNHLLEMKKEINTIKEDLDEIKSFIDGNCIVVNGLINEMNNKINNLKED